MGQQSKSGRTDQWSLQHRRLEQKSQLEFLSATPSSVVCGTISRHSIVGPPSEEGDR